MPGWYLNVINCVTILNYIRGEGVLPEEMYQECQASMKTDV
jgi:hypothetical protein